MLCSKLYTETCTQSCPYAHSLLNVDCPVESIKEFEKNKPYWERFGVILRRGQVALLIKSNSVDKSWEDDAQPKWTFPKGNFNPLVDKDPMDTAVRVFTQKTGLVVKKQWLSYGYTVKERNTHHTFFFLDISRFEADALCSLSSLDKSVKTEYRWITAMEDSRPSHGLTTEGHKLCYSVQRFMGRKYDKKTKYIEKMHAILIPFQ